MNNTSRGRRAASQKCVLHLRHLYLRLSETFIHTFVRHLTDWRPVVVTGKLMHQDVFPVDDVEVLKGLWWPETLAGRAAWKARRLISFPGMTGDEAMRARLTPSLRRVIAERRARVLHAHFGGDGLVALKAAQEEDCPLITSFYGDDIALSAADSSQRARLGPLFEGGAMFLVEGPHMRSLALRAGCPEERIRLQRISIDVESFPFTPPPQQAHRPVRVLAGGRFVEKKGILDAVRAFGHARKRMTGMELWLVGDGPLSPQVDEAIRAAGLVGSSVRRIPFLKHPEYLAVAREADIGLVASFTTARGNSEGGAPTMLLEMQAMGKPIVATRHADIPYVVREGESALLVAERDVEAMAEALVEVAGHPERWARMAQAGRAHVLERHDARKEARLLEGTYEEIGAS